MSRQLKFLIIIFLLILVFLYSISDILLPFVLGLTFAYLLDPVADRIQARKIPRHWATLIITVVFFTVISVAGVLLLPIIFEQLGEFFRQLPKFYRQFDRQIVPMILERIRDVNPMIASKFHIESKDISEHLNTIINNSIGGLFASGVNLLNFLSLILITPIVTFYMLRDWDLFVAKMYSLLPQDYAPTIKEQIKKIDDTIASFIHGQLNVCILMGLVYGLTLTLIGLNFGFIIGLFTGLLIFIPFLGFLTGATIGVLVAYFQYPNDISQVMFIAGVFITIHVVEANLISPKIIGGKIGIHPAWLIFGMLAGGSLLGLVGVIISVPMTAIVGVLVRFALEQYSTSGFYITSKPSRRKVRPIKANEAKKKA